MEVGSALGPYSSVAADLNFCITWKSDFFSPLRRAVPKQFIASIHKLALSLDLYIRLHLKGR